MLVGADVGRPSRFVQLIEHGPAGVDFARKMSYDRGSFEVDAGNGSPELITARKSKP